MSFSRFEWPDPDDDGMVSQTSTPAAGIRQIISRSEEEIFDDVKKQKLSKGS